jgi:hypothetical protein
MPDRRRNDDHRGRADMAAVDRPIEGHGCTAMESVGGLGWPPRSPLLEENAAPAGLALITQ